MTGDLIRPFRAILLLAPLLAAPLTACTGAQANRPTGADLVDKQRDGALAVFVNRKVTDQLDAESGDNVDWKFVDITRKGEMDVTVAFDDPGKVKGEVVLRDNFATVLERHRITPDRSVYTFNTVQAAKSRYYIEIAADRGGSVYTVGVSLTEPDLAGFGVGGKVIEEDNPKRWTGGGKRPPVENTPPDKQPPDPGPGETMEVPIEETPPPAEAKVWNVSGYVQRVIPVEEGGAILHIALSGKGYELIKPGATGTILQLGATVSVRSRNNSFATAFTKADAEDCRTHKNVTFQVTE